MTRWIVEHKRYWRIILLLLMIVAFLGPWMYDVINVPAKYPCDDPFIRLEGDFCGLPLSGIRFIAFFAGGLFTMITGIITGDVDLTPSGLEYLGSVYFTILVILLVLPAVTMVRFLVYGDRKRLQLFHVVVCGLNLRLTLLIGISSHLQQFNKLWGVWLFNVFTITSMILEILILATRKRFTSV